MYTATKITVCPFSNKHSAALMSPNIVNNGFRVKRSSATRVGLPWEGSEKTQPRTLIGQMKCFKIVNKLDLPDCLVDLSIENASTYRKIISQATPILWTATAGSDVVQSGRPIFVDFFQHLWPYIGNNTANVVFQMAKRLWLIRIDQ
ncbi:hypothetical protein TNCV_842161 [Trichonephila clavipes]|nr:hypothetical protein TNCV_842161 [Trichonephila clavipes]